MTQQTATKTKPAANNPRAPYQKPTLEPLRGWKALTGAPISVPITNGIINFDVLNGFDGK